MRKKILFFSVVISAFSLLFSCDKGCECGKDVIEIENVKVIWGTERSVQWGVMGNVVKMLVRQ